MQLSIRLGRAAYAIWEEEAASYRYSIASSLLLYRTLSALSSTILLKIQYTYV